MRVHSVLSRLLRLNFAYDSFSICFHEIHQICYDMQYGQRGFAHWTFVVFQALFTPLVAIDYNKLLLFSNWPFWVIHLGTQEFSCSVVSIGSWSDAPISFSIFHKHFFAHLDPTIVRSQQLFLPLAFRVKEGEPSLRVGSRSHSSVPGAWVTHHLLCVWIPKICHYIRPKRECVWGRREGCCS